MDCYLLIFEVWIWFANSYQIILSTSWSRILYMTMLRYGITMRRFSICALCENLSWLVCFIVTIPGAVYKPLCLTNTNQLMWAGVWCVWRPSCCQFFCGPCRVKIIFVLLCLSEVANISPPEGWRGWSDGVDPQKEVVEGVNISGRSTISLLSLHVKKMRRTK